VSFPFLDVHHTNQVANKLAEHRGHRVLRISFWIKLVFVVVELILAIAFVATNFLGLYDKAAILEWVIAFVFSFYVFSFVVDLYPAASTSRPTGRKTPGMNMSPRSMEENHYGSNSPDARYTEDSQRALNGQHSRHTNF
jgi:hypothetical protein